jgi:excisionase family DNA binding protein
VSAIVDALLAELDDPALDQLAALLAPRLERQAPAEDGWLRGADRIASYIDAPRSRVYSLVSAGRIPVHKDGSALVARKTELDAWVRSGGGKRP